MGFAGATPSEKVHPLRFGRRRALQAALAAIGPPLHFFAPQQADSSPIQQLFNQRDDVFAVGELP